jgi:hypothetical protein
MLIYGGRGARGKLLSDTWIFHFDDKRWEQVLNNDNLALPVPSARYYAGCISNDHQTDVYIFGGTNGTENFGDLWRFRLDNSRLMRETTHHSEREGMVMLWERLVAVGLPPAPRYGHRIVRVDEERFAVVGGCTVSPSGELVGSNMSVQESKVLQDYSSTLQKKYGDEGRLATMNGIIINNRLGYDSNDGSGGAEGSSSVSYSSPIQQYHGALSRSQSDFANRSVVSGISGGERDLGSPTRAVAPFVNGKVLKESYHQAAKLAGHLHQLELESRAAEIGLVTK